MKMLKFDREKRQLCLFLFTVCSIYFFWSLILPFNSGPDEHSRFLIPQYIYQHGALPSGWDQETRMEVWGFSYAFYPYLSGIISAFFMKITSLFTTDATALCVAARFTSVACGTVTAYFCYQISKEFFQGTYRWIFVGFVVLLPQFVFCSAYINNESLAVASVSMIIYYWVRGIKTDWPVVLCVKLGIALSVCFLSYYNTYGFILMTAVFFIACVAFQGKGKICWKQLFAKGFLIVGVVLLFAGWWFVRQVILYDGDILGRTSLNLSMEMYAHPDFKPSNKLSLYQQGYSLWTMLFQKGLVLANMDWVGTSYRSLIGAFGGLELWMPSYCYRLYTLIFGVAGIGLLLKIKAIVRHLKRAFRQKEISERNMVFFYLSLILGILITFGLSVYYSYTSDYQAQGRYLFPALVPAMLFAAMGLRSFLKTFCSFVRIPELEERAAGGVFIFAVLMQIFALASVVLPAYI